MYIFRINQEITMHHFGTCSIFSTIPGTDEGTKTIFLSDGRPKERKYEYRINLGAEKNNNMFLFEFYYLWRFQRKMSIFRKTNIYLRFMLHRSHIQWRPLKNQR